MPIWGSLYIHEHFFSVVIRVGRNIGWKLFENAHATLRRLVSCEFAILMKPAYPINIPHSKLLILVLYVRSKHFIIYSFSSFALSQ